MNKKKIVLINTINNQNYLTHVLFLQRFTKKKFLQTGLEMQVSEVGSAVQCMDQSWGTIFIGTKSGSISRFNIKVWESYNKFYTKKLYNTYFNCSFFNSILLQSGYLKPDSIQCSEKSVMALKATNEGARRVLIVASRNQKLTIRDAVTGLVLRTISGQKNYTIYSLLRDHSLIYCGTSSVSIPVFDFIVSNAYTHTYYELLLWILNFKLRILIFIFTL